MFDMMHYQTLGTDESRITTLTSCRRSSPSPRSIIPMEMEMEMVVEASKVWTK